MDEDLEGVIPPSKGIPEGYVLLAPNDIIQKGDAFETVEGLDVWRLFEDSVGMQWQTCRLYEPNRRAIRKQQRQAGTVLVWD